MWLRTSREVIRNEWPEMVRNVFKTWNNNKYDMFALHNHPPPSE